MDDINQDDDFHILIKDVFQPMHCAIIANVWIAKIKLKWFLYFK